MSKKSFVIILGLSIIVWIISGFIQFMTSLNLYSSCGLTGFPINLCIEKSSQINILVIYLANIFFWFIILFIIWKLLTKILGKQ